MKRFSKLKNTIIFVLTYDTCFFTIYEKQLLMID